MMTSRRPERPVAARPVRNRVSFRSATYAGYENRSVRNDPSDALLVRFESPMTTSSSALGTGSGRSSRASMSVKIAVFAPTPIATDKTITSAKPRLRRRARRAYSVSWRSSAK